MKSLNRFTYFFLIPIILFIGCLPHQLTVPVERPAEIDLGGIKSIAVRNFQGEHGRDISEELSQELISSGKFEVIDRRHVDQLIREYNLADMDGLIDSESAVELGNLIGVASLVYGRVAVHNYQEEPILSDPKTNFITGEEYIENVRRGRARVEVAFNVLNLETGRVLSSKRIGMTIPKETSSRGENSYPSDIDIAMLMARTRRAVVQEFMKSITPYEDMVSVKLLTHRKIPELDKGINSIRIEDWDKALEFFKQAADEHPENPKALYNLGIAYKYTYQFDKAEKYLKEAYMIRGYNLIDRILGGNTYEHAINHLRQMREDEARLQQQIGMDNLGDYENYESLDTAWVQNKLNELGYNCGVSDGIMGPKTRGCIEAYQEANGLNITGSLNQETKEALNKMR